MADKDIKELPKEQRQHMVKVITREAQRGGVINRKQTLTKVRLGFFANKIGLTGREKLSIDRQKNLSGQKDETLKIIFDKLGYKPQGKMEEALELALKMGAVTGSVRRVEIIGFDALVQYGTKSNQDLNQLSEWSFGLDGNNTILNQSFIPFGSKEK